MEESEIQHPSKRKILEDRIIYSSKPIHYTLSAPWITDFGAARIGETHKGDVMPNFYRAPEVILDMEWNSKIDIWSIGCIASHAALGN
jgi:serine/threonine protein kinase